MVFITAGMGGGTGTGAAPIIAKTAKDLGILTVGIVTKPFSFEGKRRFTQAESGIAELAKYVDSLIVIPNERLKQVEDTHITLANAFEIADDVLRRGVQSVSELINVPGFVNLDFADVTTIMKNAGYAHMGVGAAKGQDKAQLAAMAAISSPLLETSIAGATGVLVSITSSENIELEEINIASNMIYEEAHPDANIIWGARFDPNLEDEMRVTIIATGFDKIKAAEIAANKTVIQSDDEPAPAIEHEDVEQTVFTTPSVVADNAINETVKEYSPIASPVPEQTVAEAEPTKEETFNPFKEYDQIFEVVKRVKKS